MNLEKRRISLGITTSTAADDGGDDGGGGMLGIESGVGGRSVVPSERSNLMNRNQSNLQDGSTKEDDVTIDTSSESSVVDGRQQHQVLQEKLLSCDHLFPSAGGQAQRTA